MIASLRGTVIDKGLDYVVLECGGVGYHCLATPDTLSRLSRSEEAFVYTTLVVKEDSHTLFAFDTPEQRSTFGTLTGVNGIGARIALGIMSVLTPIELARAVADKDIKTLSKPAGVGKRLAERMALELSGKLDIDLSTLPASASEAAASAVGGSEIPADVREQVIEGLSGLGYSAAESARLVDAVIASGSAPADAGVATLLRLALQGIDTRRKS